MTIENNYFHKGRQYLKVRFPSDDQLEKYRSFLIKYGARDSIPRGISFHNLDDTDILDDQPCALLEPNWIHLHDWIKRLDRHSFWTKKTHQSSYLGTTQVTMPHYISVKVQAVLKDIIHGLKKSHDGGVYSGLLTQSNIENGTTGVFVSSDSDAAIIVCHNRVKERLPVWRNLPIATSSSTSASTSTSTSTPTGTASTILLDPSDQYNRIREDLLGFEILVDHLVQRFNDATIRLPMEIHMFKELYTYLPNFQTLSEIQRFEIYVWHAPLFWCKSQLLKFCNFMYVVQNKNFSACVDYSRVVGWQSLITKRGHTDRLRNIYYHNGNNVVYSGQVDKIIDFLRNAMVHLCPRFNSVSLLLYIIISYCFCILLFHILCLLVYYFIKLHAFFACRPTHLATKKR